MLASWPVVDSLGVEDTENLAIITVTLASWGVEDTQIS